MGVRGLSKWSFSYTTKRLKTLRYELNYLTDQEKSFEMGSKTQEPLDWSIFVQTLTMWIPVISDVFQSQTNLFPMLYRSSNPLRQKDWNSKIAIFDNLYLFTDICIKTCKVNSKDFAHKWKKKRIFFALFYFFEFWSNTNDYYVKKPLF